MYGIRPRWFVLAALASVALFLSGCQQDAADNQQAREEYDATPQDLQEQDQDEDRVTRNYRGPMDEKEDESPAAAPAPGDAKRADGPEGRQDRPATDRPSKTPGQPGNDKADDEKASEPNHEQFVKEVQQGLDKAQQQIEKLEQAAAELEGEAKKNLEQKIEQAQAKRREVQKQLEELKDASEQEFREQRQKLEQTLMEMLELVKPAA